MKKKYDVLILGGGPAGYMAAIHGAQKGLHTALIEGDRVGGTCLNRGCIPTKAMVEGAALWKAADKAKHFGMHVEKKNADLAGLVAWKDNTVNNLCKGISSLLQANQIDFYPHFGELVTTNTTKEIQLEGEDTLLQGDHVLLATGSQIAYPPIEGLHEAHPLTSDTILDLKEIPSHLIIIGAGVIGLEMANVYSSLGSAVTVLEMMDQVLPGMDKEMARRLNTSLKKRKINVETQAMVRNIKGTSGQEVTVHYEHKGKEKEIKGQYILVAAGRKPLLKGIPDTESPLSVNEYLETSWPSVYGAGDVIGGWYLAHVAYKEGITAMDNIAGARKTVDYRAVPNCIFTDPQAASVGQTEEELKTNDTAYIAYKFPYSALGKAVATGDIEGLVKIFTDSKGEKILGMHILGREATELIHHGVMAIQLDLTLEQLEKVIFAHPTYAESIGEIFHMARGHYYHVTPPKRK